MTHAAAAEANGGEKKRTKQLPGLEDKHDPEVSKAALKYREIRDARMKLTGEEVEAHAALVAVMQEKKLEVYRDVENEFQVIVSAKTKAKVKSLTFDEDGEDEE